MIWIALHGSVAGAGTVHELEKISFVKAFRAVLPAVQDRARVPIRVPRTLSMITSDQRLYASGEGTVNGYDLDLEDGNNDLP